MKHVTSEGVEDAKKLFGLPPETPREKVLETIEKYLEASDDKEHYLAEGRISDFDHKILEIIYPYDDTKAR